MVQDWCRESITIGLKADRGGLLDAEAEQNLVLDDVDRQWIVGADPTT